MGAGFARDLNVDSRQSRGMRGWGELDSIVEFHLIADHTGNHERFQIFEPNLARPFGATRVQPSVFGRHGERVRIRPGLTNQISIGVWENIVVVTGGVIKVDLYVLAYPFDVVVVPLLYLTRGRSFCRSIRVFIYRLGWSEDHIESSTVRFPPGE